MDPQEYDCSWERAERVLVAREVAYGLFWFAVAVAAFFAAVWALS